MGEILCSVPKFVNSDCSMIDGMMRQGESPKNCRGLVVGSDKLHDLSPMSSNQPVVQTQVQSMAPATVSEVFRL